MLTDIEVLTGTKCGLFYKKERRRGILGAEAVINTRKPALVHVGGIAIMQFSALFRHILSSLPSLRRFLKKNCPITLLICSRFALSTLPL